MSQRNQAQFLERLIQMDAALGAKGFPPMPEWWVSQVTRFYSTGKRRFVVRKGRRVTASTCVAPRLAVAEMLFGQHLHVPGTPPLDFAFLSVRRAEAAQRLAGVRAILDALGEPFRERTRESIELVNRPARFVVVTADTKTAVGGTVAFAWCDEVARWTDEETGANPAEQVISSLSPALATLPDARLFLISSPLSSDDYHARAFEKGDTANQTTAFGETWTIVPNLLSRDQCRALCETEREFLREYAAQPSAARERAFENLDHVVIRGRKSIPYQPHTQYGLTVDVGLRNDATAAMVYHRELRKREGAPPLKKLIIDRVLVLRPSLLKKVTLDRVENEVYSLAQEYRVSVVRSDLHMADALAPRWASRALRHEEIPMNVAAQSARTSKLLSHVEAGTIELLDDDDLLKELKTAQLRLSGGRWLLSAPEKRGAHDDILDCLLIACEHSEVLPLGGAGDVRSRRVNGERCWYVVHPDGTSTPSHPPIGSRDFLELCHRARREGFMTPEIEAFLSEPANVEAVDAFQERMLRSQQALSNLLCK